MEGQTDAWFSIRTLCSMRWSFTYENMSLAEDLLSVGPLRPNPQEILQYWKGTTDQVCQTIDDHFRLRILALPSGFLAWSIPAGPWGITSRECWWHPEASCPGESQRGPHASHPRPVLRGLSVPRSQPFTMPGFLMMQKTLSNRAWRPYDAVSISGGQRPDVPAWFCKDQEDFGPGLVWQCLEAPLCHDLSMASQSEGLKSALLLFQGSNRECAGLDLSQIMGDLREFWWESDSCLAGKLCSWSWISQRNA